MPEADARHLLGVALGCDTAETCKQWVRRALAALDSVRAQPGDREVLVDAEDVLAAQEALTDTAEHHGSCRCGQCLGLFTAQQETELLDTIMFELEGGLGGKRDFRVKGDHMQAARRVMKALDRRGFLARRLSSSTGTKEPEVGHPTLRLYGQAAEQPTQGEAT